MNSLKQTLIALSFLATTLLPLALPATASADVQGSLCGAATQLSVNAGSVDCQTATSGSENHFQGIAKDIVNILSVVVGIAAVVMIIFAGFRYITSGGNQESVKTAKQALIYAIIGIVIVALAQIIANFVFTHATNPPASNSGKPPPHGL